MRTAVIKSLVSHVQIQAMQLFSAAIVTVIFIDNYDLEKMVSTEHLREL